MHLCLVTYSHARSHGHSFRHERLAADALIRLNFSTVLAVRRLQSFSTTLFYVSILSKLSIFGHDNRHKQTTDLEPSRACFFIRSHKALSYTLHAPVSPRVFYYALLHVQASATGPAILAATTKPPYCLRDTTTTTQPDTLHEQASRIHPHHHHRFRPSTMRRFLTFRACRRCGGTSAASLPFCTR